MAYLIKLPPDVLKNLWELKQYCGAGSIVEQVRYAVRNYIEVKEKEIGTTIEDAAEAIERYEREKENQDYDNFLPRS